jgi:hypothetical protein
VIVSGNGEVARYLLASMYARCPATCDPSNARAESRRFVSGRGNLSIAESSRPMSRQYSGRLPRSIFWPVEKEALTLHRVGVGLVGAPPKFAGDPFNGRTVATAPRLRWNAVLSGPTLSGLGYR